MTPFDQSKPVKRWLDSTHRQSLGKPAEPPCERMGPVPAILICLAALYLGLYGLFSLLDWTVTR